MEELIERLDRLFQGDASALRLNNSPEASFVAGMAMASLVERNGKIKLDNVQILNDKGYEVQLAGQSQGYFGLPVLIISKDGKEFMIG